MSELIRSSPSETSIFMKSLGYDIDPKRIVQNYPVSFPKRKVFRVAGEKGSKDRVLKVRPADQKARMEEEKLRTLFASYRYHGGHFPAVKTIELPQKQYLAFKMSYLGRALSELCQDLDLLEVGQIERGSGVFQGFSGESIQQLVDNLSSSHRNFTRDYGLIHGDLIQKGSPNNVVFHSELGRLFLVDAEALTPINEASQSRFEEQIGRLEEWMVENLLAES